MSTFITDFNDVEYLQRVIIHLYDLLDDIDTADDMVKGDDVSYRALVSKLQARKNDSGVSSPDGYCLHITPIKFKTKDERGIESA